jgi:hypothetical protein
MLWLTVNALPLLLLDPESGETTKLPDCFKLLPLLRIEVVSILGPGLLGGGVELRLAAKLDVNLGGSLLR